MCTALSRLVEDPALRARLGANARQAARERFHRNTVMAQWSTLYDSLIEVREERSVKHVYR